MKNKIFASLALLYSLSMALSAQSVDPGAFLEAVTDKSNLSKAAEFDIAYRFKSAMGDDTSGFAGRVLFFKDTFDKDSIAQFIWFLEGKMSAAYDARHFYRIDNTQKKVQATSSGKYPVQEIIKGNLARSTMLFMPFLSVAQKPFIVPVFDTVFTRITRNPEYIELKMMLQDSFLNEDKMSPTDPDMGFINREYTVSLPDFSLREFTDWVYFMRTPQYRQRTFSAIRPLPAHVKFHQIFNLDSLVQAGYKLEDYDPNAPVEQLVPIVKEGDMLPRFQLTGIDGQKTDSDDLKEGILLIDFWYRSCAPCLKAMPFIEHLHQTYGKQGLTVLGINPVDKEPAKLLSFLEERHITYPTLLDTEKMLPQKFGITGYPVLLLVDASTHKVIYVQKGYGVSVEQTLETQIKTSLNVK